MAIAVSAVSKVTRLCEQLAANDPAVEEADLSYQGLGAADARLIAAALRSNAHLTFLGLHSNTIKDEGAVAIAGALQSPGCHLTVLNLNINGIGDSGARAIAEALTHNDSLEELWLGNNKISNQGAYQFIASLKGNTRLGKLWLRNNPAEPALLDQIQSLLATEPTARAAVETESLFRSLCPAPDDTAGCEVEETPVEEDIARDETLDDIWKRLEATTALEVDDEDEDARAIAPPQPFERTAERTAGRTAGRTSMRSRKQSLPAIGKAPDLPKKASLHPPLRAPSARPPAASRAPPPPAPTPAPAPAPPPRARKLSFAAAGAAAAAVRRLSVGARFRALLAQVAADNPALLTVEANSLAIDDDGALRLAAALRANTTATALNLRNNRCCHAGQCTASVALLQSPVQGGTDR